MGKSQSVNFNVIVAKLIVYSDIIGKNKKWSKSLNSCELVS